MDKAYDYSPRGPWFETREGLNLFCIFDGLRLRHKKLGAEAHYYVMINAAMTCLTVKETVKSLMIGRKTKIKKSFVKAQLVQAFSGPCFHIKKTHQMMLLMHIGKNDIYRITLNSVDMNHIDL